MLKTLTGRVSYFVWYVLVIFWSVGERFSLLRPRKVVHKQHCQGKMFRKFRAVCYRYLYTKKGSSRISWYFRAAIPAHSKRTYIHFYHVNDLKNILGFSAFIRLLFIFLFLIIFYIKSLKRIWTRFSIFM